MGRWIALVLLPVSAAAVDLPEAIRAAAQRDPGVQAAGIRLLELDGAAQAAQGPFDLVGDFTLTTGLGSQIDDFRGNRVSLDRQTVGIEAALSQRLVWGTTLTASFTNSYATGDTFNLQTLELGTQDTWQSGLGLQVRQPLLRGFGREINTLAQAQVEAADRVAQAQQRVTVAAVVQEVVVVWAELAYAEANVRIRQRALELALTQKSSASRQVEGGRMAPVDLAVVEQAVAEREQALFVAQQAVAQRQAELQVRTGLKVETAVLPEAPAWLQTQETTAADALKANFDLLVVDAELESQRMRLPALRNDTRAQLDLTVGANHAGVDDTFTGGLSTLPDNQSYGASLRLGLPFQNRAAEGELYQAEKALERAHAQRAGRVQAIQLEVDQALRALRTAEQAQGLALRVFELAEKSLAAEQRRLELGRATQLDVLEVSQKSAEAALSVERARADRVLAAARLQALTGRLLEAYGIVVEARTLVGAP
jgi:outer membrane protein